MQKRKFEHYVSQLAALTMHQRRRLFGLLLPVDWASQALQAFAGATVSLR